MSYTAGGAGVLFLTQEPCSIWELQVTQVTFYLGSHRACPCVGSPEEEQENLSDEV